MIPPQSYKFERLKFLDDGKIFDEVVNVLKDAGKLMEVPDRASEPASGHLDHPSAQQLQQVLFSALSLRIA
jgi:hypothetical protein